MKNYEMTEAEERLARLIWQNEPMPSGELVKMCSSHFGWKKSTTYTMLKKVCAGGVFKNENAVVTSLVSEKGYASIRSRNFVERTFDGSLQNFLTAFTGGKKLSKEQAQELKKFVDEYGEN